MLWQNSDMSTSKSGEGEAGLPIPADMACRNSPLKTMSQLKALGNSGACAHSEHCTDKKTRSLGSGLLMFSTQSETLNAAFCQHQRWPHRSGRRCLLRSSTGQ